MKYEIERRVNEGSTGYDKQGEIEWRVVNVQTRECHEIFPRKWQAKEMVDAWNLENSCDVTQ
jgi:hypothetical protein